MSTPATQDVLAGTWSADPVHSWLGFAVMHHHVALFRGQVDEVSATLADGRLSGSAPISSISVRSERLKERLLEPDFFDGATHPEARFESSSIQADGGELVVEGELELKGVRRPVRLTGTISAPVEDPRGVDRIGISLETTIDRTDFGVSATGSEMPGGGYSIGRDVTVQAELQLIKQD
jgi:polyisoprenoid-binding protein YceI